MVMEEEQSDMELASESIPVPRVHKATKTVNAETTNKSSSVPRVKPRLRKKALHAAILKQMEFYFSDANLTKDRFLGHLIKQDPYIDLNIFTKFNKIRELTTDTNRIAKALQASTMLSVSEDGSKVYRTTPVQEKQNIDECTVYVQNLPPDADHDWLTSTFSQYGSVAYVSLPRYKSSKKIKGFAFVEFDTPDNAIKCLKSFQKKGCMLPSHTSPDELLSITTFDDAEKDVTIEGKTVMSIDQQGTHESTSNNKTLPETDESICKGKGPENSKVGEENQVTPKESELTETMDLESDEKESKKAKKRKHRNSECIETLDAECLNINDEMSVQKKKKKKKIKHSDQESQDDNQNHSENTVQENSLSVLDNSQQNEQCRDECIDESFKKVKRKNKKIEPVSKEDTNVLKENDVTEQKATNNSTETMEVSNEPETLDNTKKKRKRKRKSKIEDPNCNMGLQVMAKCDWKHLRNKYLELQRSKMKQLKQHLRKTRWNQWSNYEKNRPIKEETDENEQKAPKVENSNPQAIPFVPGVIVKIEMDDCCTDPKSFKNELKGHNGIKYIDVYEGAYHAFVRCDTAEAAQSFAQKSNEKRRTVIVEGEEERQYWDKISRDRDEKLGKKVKPKQRGRDKLLKKAEKELGKHIKFDEV